MGGEEGRNLREMGKSKDAAALRGVTSILSPDAVEGSSSSPVETSAQSGTVSCAFAQRWAAEAFYPIYFIRVSGSCDGVHLSLTFLCFSGNFTLETDSVCY